MSTSRDKVKSLKHNNFEQSNDERALHGACLPPKIKVQQHMPKAKQQLPEAKSAGAEPSTPSNCHQPRTPAITWRSAPGSAKRPSFRELPQIGHCNLRGLGSGTHKRMCGMVAWFFTKSFGAGHALFHTARTSFWPAIRA